MLRLWRPKHLNYLGEGCKNQKGKAMGSSNGNIIWNANHQHECWLVMNGTTSFEGSCQLGMVDNIKGCWTKSYENNVLEWI